MEENPRFRSITKSVFLQTDGVSLQVAYLQLDLPKTISNQRFHALELEAASLMRSVASKLDSALFGE